MTFAERFAQLRRRGKSGSAALEFAFVAPVFFVLMMGTLESGVIFFAQNVLTEAVDDAGRQIRTGAAQSTDHTKNADGTPTQYANEADWFKQQICSGAGILLPNCTTTLQIDVESTGSFGSLAFPSPLLADGTLNPAATGYNPGTACNVVLVRAYYPWAVATPVLSWEWRSSSPAARREASASHDATSAKVRSSSKLPRRPASAWSDACAAPRSIVPRAGAASASAASTARCRSAARRRSCSAFR